MTEPIASLAARIWPDTCSAERTIPSSSFSTLSAIRQLLKSPPRGSLASSDHHKSITSHVKHMDPMLDLQEGHVFVELTYPHLIGLRVCRASRSGELHTGLIRGWNRAPIYNVDVQIRPAPIVPNDKVRANHGEPRAERRTRS